MLYIVCVRMLYMFFFKKKISSSGEIRGVDAKRQVVEEVFVRLF